MKLSPFPLNCGVYTMCSLHNADESFLLSCFERMPLVNLIVFSDNIHGNGRKIRDLIHKLGLGVVTTSEVRDNPTHQNETQVEVYVWSINRPALFKWATEKGRKRIDDNPPGLFEAYENQASLEAFNEERRRILRETEAKQREIAARKADKESKSVLNNDF